MNFLLPIGKWFVAIALLLTIARAQAHDPFDASVHFTVEEDRIQAALTLGLDAAKELLSNAGFSAEQISNIARQSGPRSAKELPTNVVTHCLLIESGAMTLTSTNATSLSDGVEVTFVFLYPRPDGESLKVRAIVYEEINQLRPGSFIATDGHGRKLGSAVLSRASVTANVSLPPEKSIHASDNSANTTPAAP